MDFKFLVHTVRILILNPVKEWDTIHSENKTVEYISRNLFFPLLITASVSAFLGSFLFINTELSNVYSVLTGVKYFLVLSLVIYGTAFIFRQITGAFGFGSDFNLSFKIIVCSAVPLLLCQIVSRLFESFIFINILSFFGLYILWTGIEKMLNPPERKKILLMISATVTFIALFFIANWILTLVIDKLYFSFFA
jgi:hypothetical protein